LAATNPRKKARESALNKQHLLTLAWEPWKVVLSEDKIARTSTKEFPYSRRLGLLIVAAVEVSDEQEIASLGRAFAYKLGGLE